MGEFKLMGGGRKCLIFLFVEVMSDFFSMCNFSLEGGDTLPQDIYKPSLTKNSLKPSKTYKKLHY